MTDPNKVSVYMNAQTQEELALLMHRWDDCGKAAAVRRAIRMALEGEES